jgi:hypothetical protein
VPTAPRPADDEPIYLEASSLWLLRPHHPLRLWLEKVVKHPWFERLILFCILVSSIVLALESPKTDPRSKLAQAVKVGWRTVARLRMRDFLRASRTGHVPLLCLAMTTCHLAGD